jgi:hypothetical protein
VQHSHAAITVDSKSAHQRSDPVRDLVCHKHIYMA